MLFNTRETYITAVREWKQAYKDLSLTIRQNRIEFRATESKLDRGVGDTSDRSSLQKRLYQLRTLLVDSKYTANQMLTERAEGKIEAQRQYLAEHPALEIA